MDGTSELGGKNMHTGTHTSGVAGTYPTRSRRGFIVSLSGAHGFNRFPMVTCLPVSVLMGRTRLGWE